MTRQKPTEDTDSLSIPTGKPRKKKSREYWIPPCRCTRAERNRFDQLVKESGKSASAYNLDRLLDRESPTPLVSNISIDTYAELAKLAGTLKQIAAHWNPSPSTDSEAQAQMNELAQQLQNCVELIQQTRLEVAGISTSSPSSDSVPNQD